MQINHTHLHYYAPWWLPGGHLQTIYSARLAPRSHAHEITLLRERWETPDEDFLDVDWLVNDSQNTSSDIRADEKNRPLLVLFHGLEGTSNSHYVQTFAYFAKKFGYQFALPYFRSCSGEINRAKRIYYSGDWQEIDWLLKKFKTRHLGPIIAIGISLGGNSLVRWAGEAGVCAKESVTAIASICAPLDMKASGMLLGKGFNRLIYTQNFLSTLIPKALQKWEQYPGLFNREKLMAARDLFTFDEIFTAPIHGFSGALDYWQQTSAKPHLGRIQVPCLLLNTQNDPFIPKASLPTSSDCSPYVTLWQPKVGGHVGFPCSPISSKGLYHVPQIVGQWLTQAIGKPTDQSLE